MPSSYTTNNGLILPATGELNNSWGTAVNDSLTNLVDQALDGWVSVTLSAATATLAITDGVASDGRNRLILFTGSPGAACTVTVSPNDAEKWFFVYNGTTGDYNVIIAQGGGAGSTVTVANGYWSIVRLDGTGSNANVTRVLDSFEVSTAIKASTVTAAGSIAVKPGADSTTALSFQNSTGTQVLGIDTTNNRAVIGTTVPACKFEVNNNTVAVAPLTAGDFQITASDAGAGSRIAMRSFTIAPQITGIFANGTAAIPTAVTTAQYLNAFQARGYLATGYSGTVAEIALYAEDNFTDVSAPTGMLFYTTPSGSITSVLRMRVNKDGQVVIGPSTPATSALLDLQSTTGALVLPRMTTVQRDALTGASGMLIYNTSTNKLNVYTGAAWEVVTSA